MVTPPALPNRNVRVSLASKVRVWLAVRVPEKEFLPSAFADTHTMSPAVTSTRTGALGFEVGI